MHTSDCIAAAQQFSHAHIADVVAVNETTPVCIFMELCEGGVPTLCSTGLVLVWAVIGAPGFVYKESIRKGGGGGLGGSPRGGRAGERGSRDRPVQRR